MSPSTRSKRRFITDQTIDTGRTVCLSHRESAHLARVLRLRKGDGCLVTDGRGLEFEATISDFLKDGRAQLKVEHPIRRPPGNPGPVVRVSPSLLQRGKMDGLVRWAQEIGADEFSPFAAERSAWKLGRDAEAKVLQRWHKIAVEAAKQSGSVKLMGFKPPQCAVEFAKTAIPGECAAIFHTGKEAVAFESWAAGLREAMPGGRVSRLTLFWGPEGGFSEAEVGTMERLFLENHMRVSVVSLGPMVLKADTAFLGALAALFFSVVHPAWAGGSPERAEHGKR